MWDRQTKDGFLFRLRPATSDDESSILANIQSVCDERVYLYTDEFILTDQWQRLMASPVDESAGYLLLLAEAGKNVIGHLRLFPSWYGAKGRHVGDLGLTIVKEWRERGIGTAMINYALQWAGRAGFRKLTASLMATNRRGLNLFSKFDFVEEARRPQQLEIDGQYVDEVMLARFLGGRDMPYSASVE